MDRDETGKGVFVTAQPRGPRTRLRKLLAPSDGEPRKEGTQPPAGPRSALPRGR